MTGLSGHSTRGQLAADRLGFLETIFESLPCAKLAFTDTRCITSFGSHTSGEVCDGFSFWKRRQASSKKRLGGGEAFPVGIRDTLQV